MKERNDLTGCWIWSSDITPFVTVTEHTGKRQVAECRSPTVLTSQNMINLITDVAIAFMNQAILTPAPSATAYLLA